MFWCVNDSYVQKVLELVAATRLKQLQCNPLGQLRLSESDRLRLNITQTIPTERDILLS